MIKGENVREDLEGSLPAVYICSRYRPKSADSEGMRREVALAVAMDKPIRAFSEDYQLDLADKLEGVPISQQKSKFNEKLDEALHIGNELKKQWKGEEEHEE